MTATGAVTLFLLSFGAFVAPAGLSVAPRPAPPVCPAGASSSRGPAVQPFSGSLGAVAAVGCKDARGVWQGPYEERYADGRVAAAGRLEGGLREGLWTLYFRDGRIEERGAYSHDAQQGAWTAYHPNGALATRGAYAHGKHAGRWLTFYPDGRMTSWSHAVDGVLDGPYASWYDDGQLESEGAYHRGWPVGAWSYYFRNGRLMKAGAFLGTHREPPRNVELPAETGKWTFWREDGSKAAEGCFRQGREIGVWTRWFDDGRTPEKKTWSQDECLS